MSYQDYEKSVAGGKPIELYDFSLASTHWRITSSGEDYVYLGNTYEDVPCERNEMEQTDDPFKDRLEVTLPRGHPLAALYIPGVPEGEIALTIYRGHEGNIVVFWQGYVEACSFDKDAIPKLILAPRSSSQSGVGRRRRCMRLCDHNLYEYGCFVNQESFEVEGTIDSIDGLTIVSSDFAEKDDDWFRAGKIIVGDATRFIKSHITDTIIINRTIPGAQAGDSFTAYAGCNHAGDTCKNIFGNKLNFGGEENLPKKNPFSCAIDSLAGSDTLFRRRLRF